MAKQPPYEMEVYLYHDHIHIRIEGEDSVETSVDYWRRVFDLCREHDQHRVLVEEHLRGYLDSALTYRVAREISRMAEDLNVKLAFLDPHPGHNISNDFGETITRNRGMNTKSFLDMESARAWLLAETEEPG